MRCSSGLMHYLGLRQPPRTQNNTALFTTTENERTHTCGHTINVEIHTRRHHTMNADTRLAALPPSLPLLSCLSFGAGWGAWKCWHSARELTLFDESSPSPPAFRGPKYASLGHTCTLHDEVWGGGLRGRGNKKLTLKFYLHTEKTFSSNYTGTLMCNIWEMVYFKSTGLHAAFTEPGAATEEKTPDDAPSCTFNRQAVSLVPLKVSLKWMND